MAISGRLKMCYITAATLSLISLLIVHLFLPKNIWNLSRCFRDRGVLSEKEHWCHKEVNSPDQWLPPTLPQFLASVSQDDPHLVNHICKEWLLPPFTEQRYLQKPNVEHYSQRGQSKFVDNLLQHKTDGFFIESGAADGEGLSNSLFFEKSRNWTGLLVEANPVMFKSLLKKRRHAYMVNACLSPSTKPVKLPFTLASYIGGLTGFMEATHKRRIEGKFSNTDTIQIQCFPLYSILKAMHVMHVDYFSLDIEGAELEVLYTLPLNEITVDVFSIEYLVSNNPRVTAKKLAAVKKYLVDVHGYRVVRVGKGEDVILKKQ